jgi:hypothetical protein
MTRMVVCIGPYAIKLPRVSWGVYYFVKGWLDNLTEARISDQFKNTPKWSELVCPVRRSLCGLILIMDRASPITKDRYKTINKQLEAYKDITSDLKPDNFGELNGRIVLVDYA